jgi:hypothetical protein
MLPLLPKPCQESKAELFRSTDREWVRPFGVVKLWGRGCGIEGVSRVKVLSGLELGMFHPLRADDAPPAGSGSVVPSFAKAAKLGQPLSRRRGQEALRMGQPPKKILDFNYLESNTSRAAR